jgi:hypothetical protein
VFSSYSALFTEAASYALFALIAFIVLFTLILTLIAKSDSSLAIRGLFVLLGSFFAAPFHYLRSVIRTLIAHQSNADSARTESKQYLLQKLILLSNAALLVSTIAILAAGVVMSWIVLSPPQERAQRRALSAQIDEMDKAIETRQTEAAKAKADADPAKVAARIAQTEQNVAKLTADLESARKRAAEMGTGQQAFQAIETYLQRQPARSEGQVDSMAQEIVRYVNTNVSDEAGKQVLQAYAAAWQQLAKANVEGDALRRTMQQEKAQADAAESQIKAMTERLEQLKAARSEMGFLVTGANVWASFTSLLGTFFMAFCWVWVLGVAIESAGLFIDVAENVRRVRAAAEQQPQPGLAVS